MRYLALACDYDGTLAQHGRVDETTLAALEKFRASGRRLLLVTGRELEDLWTVFPNLHFFERLVAENGAVLFHPGSRQIVTLAEAPGAAFVDALRRRQVSPLSVGRVIVATRKPQETAVLETIRDLGLELQLIFNKDAVMVLPAGVNKATGLAAALRELDLSPHEVVGIGDAENDHAFLSLCECAVAVRNALPTVQERADLVAREEYGRGVEKLIEHILANDLQDLQDQPGRHRLLLGRSDFEDEVGIPTYGCNLLIAGPSGSGKSTVSKSFLERLQEQHYQFCIVDPEGDYDALEGAVTIGVSKHGFALEEVLQLLKKPDANVVVNLVGLPLADRPGFFLALLPRLQEIRGRTSRPHWMFVDETHHLLPSTWAPAVCALPQQLERTVFITVHPENIMPVVLAAVTDVIAVGPDPEKTIVQFCEAVKESPPPMGLEARMQKTDAVEKDRRVSDPGQVLLWPRGKGINPYRLKVIPSQAEHRRHVWKYAEGELPTDRCFFFRGPARKLNLRAQNLILFNQIAAGVDDATWLHHLGQKDYSRWFRESIHDDILAEQAEQIEAMSDAPAAETRKRIKDLIARYYTPPVSAPVPMPGTNAESKKEGSVSELVSGE
jgi:hydroxymethylpyrimidine pyrophosphatase-like HAD family hydrolase